MTRIKGTTVILIQKKEVSKDGFNRPVYDDVEIEVPNVLISPTSSEDVVNQLNLTGKKAVYTLGIPKEDTHDWTDCEVRFFGKRWKVFGEPLKGLDHLIPLDWNTKVTVEHYG